MPVGERVHANGCAHGMTGHCFCPETKWKMLPGWMFAELMEYSGYPTAQYFETVNYLEMQYSGLTYVAPMGTPVPPRTVRPSLAWVRVAIPDGWIG